MGDTYKHKFQDKLEFRASIRNHKGFVHPILLTGEASTGKSSGAELLAEKLDLSYGYTACNRQMTTSQLLGFKGPTGEYYSTPFVNAYRNGGVFVLEEMDAADTNVMISLNTAIDGHLLATPIGTIERHKDFILIATTNTYNGANESYNARSRMDESTYSRFSVINWTLDVDLEASLLDDKLLHIGIQQLREKLGEMGTSLLMRDVLTYNMLTKAGESVEDAAISTVLRNVDKIHHDTLLSYLQKPEVVDEPFTM